MSFVSSETFDFDALLNDYGIIEKRKEGEKKINEQFENASLTMHFRQIKFKLETNRKI